jgi:hypothetical protein
MGMVLILFISLAIPGSIPVAASSCEELKVGEAQNIIGQTEHGANIRRYRIHRRSENRYEVLFNPKFSHVDLSKQFNKCFQSGHLLETPNGKQVRIMASPLAPEIEIRRKDRPGPATRDQWHSAMDCGWMAHELLHWAGLCDEYGHALNRTSASNSTRASNFPCRRVRENNLMGLNSKDTQNVLLDDQFNQIILPSCPVNSTYTECAKQAYSFQSSGCKKAGECKDVLSRPISVQPPMEAEDTGSEATGQR